VSLAAGEFKMLLQLVLLLSLQSEAVKSLAWPNCTESNMTDNTMPMALSNTQTEMASVGLQRLQKP
jgi:hypothetical protein